MAWLGAQLGVVEPEDWYRLTRGKLRAVGGSDLLDHFGSLAEVLRDYQPEHDWKEWLFRRVPNGFWDDPGNGRRYLDWLGEILGFTRADDWYRLSSRDLTTNRGSTLLGRHGMSPSRVVMELMPEHEWLPWKFTSVPTGFWDHPANRRRYLRWLGDVLGFSAPEHWYRLRASHLLENEGCTLLGRFGGSPSALLREVMPRRDWKEWRFGHAPIGFWLVEENRRRFLEWLAREVGIDHWEQWYEIPGETFKAHGGDGLLALYEDSHSAMLAACLPEHEWLPWRFPHAPKHIWEKAENRAAYLEWLVEELGFRGEEGWRRLHFGHLRAHHGVTLTYRYRSVRGIAEDSFPSGHPALRALGIEVGGDECPADR